jgi:hypothetical protein
MAAFVNTSRMVLLGTAWSGGSAPGLPGTQTVAGTITTPQDISGFTMDGAPSTSVAMQDGTTFGNGGFVVQYPGLKSGDTISFDLVADYAASQLFSIVETTLGGLAAAVFVDLKPTNATRSATNPSFVAAAWISKWAPFSGAVGSLAKGGLEITITGKFGYLTA